MNFIGVYKAWRYKISLQLSKNILQASFALLIWKYFQLLKRNFEQMHLLMAIKISFLYMKCTVYADAVGLVACTSYRSEAV